MERDYKSYHYGARYYDPQLGRWLQVDPADEFNSPYVYVGNMPIIAVDPDGEEFDISNLSFEDKVTFYQCVKLMKYLGMDDEYNYLNSSTKVIKVVFVRGNFNYDVKYQTRADLEKNIIYFNPNYDLQALSASYYNNKNLQFVATTPPVVALFHEVVHMKHWIKNPSETLKRYDKSVRLWGNEEEKITIKRENIFLLKLSNKLGINLGQREAHGGYATPTKNLFEPSTLYYDVEIK